MERLNSKLYDKYKNLKKRKESEVAEWNSKLDADFRNYQMVVEGVIEELKNKNNQLRAQISSLEDNYADCQQTLLEENQKMKELSNEVERLHNLLSMGSPCSNKNGNNETAPSDSLIRSSKVRPRESSKGLVQKMTPNSCIRQNEVQNEAINIIHHDSCQEEQIVPDCCRRNITSSENGNEKDHVKCVFQTLVESLVGMKFSVENRTDGLCLSVIHRSSGYSFSLTWKRNTDGEDGELLYRVSSLGTLERVAVEWMKEDLVFTTTMCHVFFERISRVIGGRQ